MPTLAGRDMTAREAARARKLMQTMYGTAVPPGAHSTTSDISISRNPAYPAKKPRAKVPPLLLPPSSPPLRPETAVASPMLVDEVSQELLLTEERSKRAARLEEEASSSTALLEQLRAESKEAQGRAVRAAENRHLAEKKAWEREIETLQRQLQEQVRITFSSYCSVDIVSLSTGVSRAPVSERNSSTRANATEAQVGV